MRRQANISKLFLLEVYWFPLKTFIVFYCVSNYLPDHVLFIFVTIYVYKEREAQLIVSTTFGFGI